MSNQNHILDLHSARVRGWKNSKIALDSQMMLKMDPWKVSGCFKIIT